MVIAHAFRYYQEFRKYLKEHCMFRDEIGLQFGKRTACRCKRYLAISLWFSLSLVDIAHLIYVYFNNSSCSTGVSHLLVVLLCCGINYEKAKAGSDKHNIVTVCCVFGHSGAILPQKACAYDMAQTSRYSEDKYIYREK